MAIKADFSNIKTKPPNPNTDVVVRVKPDLFQFLKDNNVGIQVNTNCPKCDFDYLSLKTNEVHVCGENRAINIINPEVLDKLTNTFQYLPQHTKECNSFMVGGVAMGNDRPNNRKVWKCSDKCPLKE